MIGNETEIPAVDVVDAGGLFAFQSGLFDQSIELIVKFAKSLKDLF